MDSRTTLWELHACRTPKVNPGSAMGSTGRRRRPGHPPHRQGPRVRQGIRMQKLPVLSGGMGGARFLQGLLHAISTGRLPGVAADAAVTVIANTADDLWIHGLKVCPDL